MAATNYTPISLYYSITASAEPLNTSLVNGELAINITDGKLFYKENSGVVQVLATKSGAQNSISFGTTGLTPNTATQGAVTVAGTLITSNGGTGLSSYTAGDITYYASGTALSKLGIGTANYVLTSSGTAPQWSQNLSIGSLTASSDSSFTSTGALRISKGTNAQQPGTPVTGMIRYNTDTNQFEGYSGASPAWKSIGGSALSNDTSTSSNLYPTFAGATTGTAENLYTSNAKLLYKPSTGEFQASVPVASNGIFVNSQTVATSYTVAAGYSAMSSGPVTVASGQSVTVSSGSRWVVV